MAGDRRKGNPGPDRWETIIKDAADIDPAYASQGPGGRQRRGDRGRREPASQPAGGRGEVQDLRGAMAALTTALEESQRRQAVLHEEFLLALRSLFGDQLMLEHQRERSPGGTTEWGATVPASLATSDQLAELAGGMRRELAALVASVRDELAELSDGLRTGSIEPSGQMARRPDLPASVRALPEAVAALRDQLTEYQRRQQTLLEQSLDGIETRIVDRVTGLRRDDRDRQLNALKSAITPLQEQLGAQQKRAADDVRVMREDIGKLAAAAGRAPHVPEQLAGLPAALTSLRGQVAELSGRQHSLLTEYRRELQARQGELAVALQGVLSQVEALHEVVEKGVEVPEPVLTLPAAVAALGDQLAEQQRRHFAQSVELVQGLRDDLATFSEQMVYGLEQIVDAQQSAASTPLARLAEIAADIERLHGELRDLRGDVAALDEGLGRLSESVKAPRRRS